MVVGTPTARIVAALLLARTGMSEFSAWSATAKGGPAMGEHSVPVNFRNTDGLHDPRGGLPLGGLYRVLPCG